MLNTRDSVGDSRNSPLAALHYRDKEGDVKKITRTTHRRKSNDRKGPQSSNTPDAIRQLLIHLLPPTATADMVKRMLQKHTHIVPVSVVPKTFVTFASAAHAKLAFETLEGPARPEMTGLLQKKVHL